MTDTTPEAVERLARVLDGPFYRVEGYAGPYIDEATLRDEHTAAAATLRAQQAEIARLKAALALLTDRSAGLVHAHHHGNGLEGWYNKVDGVDRAITVARAALEAEQ